MNHAMTHVYGNAVAARSLHSSILITRSAANPAAGMHLAAARLLREDGERYTADPDGDEDDAAGASVSDSADWHTRHARDAQALLDDAVNLIGTLLDAVEKDGDTRAEQARTVLGMAVECLHGAHRAIEEQESRDETLYLAYAGLQAAVEEEERVPVDDFPSDDGRPAGRTKAAVKRRRGRGSGCGGVLSRFSRFFMPNQEPSNKVRCARGKTIHPVSGKPTRKLPRNYPSTTVNRLLRLYSAKIPTGRTRYLVTAGG